MYLITPSLLSSFHFYINYEPEITKTDEENNVTIEQKEAEKRKEFLSTLRREKTAVTEKMQAGIDFENRLQAHCEGTPDDDKVIQELGAILKGGMWQERMKREFEGFLLYARADVIKRDTIYDLKRSKSYEIGNYGYSAQHRIELFCSGMPKFSYLISDDRNWYREDYYNHEGIEQEIRSMIRDFTGYLETDPEASDLFYSNWKSLESQAA